MAVERHCTVLRWPALFRRFNHLIGRWTFASRNTASRLRQRIAAQRPAWPHSAYPWFNTAAFAVPAATSFTYGNSGQNSLEGPGTKYVDFSIFKDTHLTESKVLQLRAEAFDLANAPQLNNPAATAAQPPLEASPRQVRLDVSTNCAPDSVRCKSHVLTCQSLSDLS